MEKEWKIDAADALFEKVKSINEHKDLLGKPFAIIGFAVENEETGEGAYLSIMEDDGSLLISDILEGASKDLQDRYFATLTRIR